MSLSKRTRNATALDIDNELMSPGLMVPLRPDTPLLVSMGTAQNGVDMRGKNIHIAIARGAAYRSKRPPVAKLRRTDSFGSADIRNQAVMMKIIATTR